MADRPIRRSRVRLKSVLLLALVLVGALGGAYGLYRYRKERNTDALLIQAQAAAARHDTSAAVGPFQQYLHRRPTDVAAVRAYVELLLKAEVLTPDLAGELVRNLQRLQRLDPTDVGAVEKLTRLYLDVREFTSADSLSTAWLQLAPDSPDAIIARARTLHGLRRNEQARDVLVAAARQSPQEPRFYPPLIELFAEALSRPDEADAWLQTALSNAPESPAVHLAAFSLHQTRGNLEPAQRHLEQALDLAPADAELLARAVRFFITRGNFTRAEHLMEQADAATRANRKVRSARAALAIGRKDLALMAVVAAEMLSSANDAADPELVAQAAELYLRTGNLEAAGRCIQQLATSSPIDARTNQYLTALRGAQALLAGRPFVAIPLLQQALQDQPTSQWGTEMLALAYETVGALDESADLYRRAIVLAPESEALRVRLALMECGQDHCPAALSHPDAFADRTASSPPDAAIRVLCDVKAAIQKGTSADIPPQVRRSLASLTALDNLDAASTNLLAKALILIGEAGEAVELAARHLKTPAGERLVSADFWTLLLRERLFQSAQSWADVLIDAAPDSLAGHALRVRTLAAANNLDEAAHHASQSTLDAHPRGELLAVLADSFLDAGRIDSAIAALREAVRLYPENISAWRAIARYAPSAEEQVAARAKIRGIEGEDGLFWRFETAWSLLRNPSDAVQTAQAAEILQRCLSRRPGWVSARLLLALAYERLGKYSDAVAAHRTARTQRPELAADPSAIRFIELLKRLGLYDEADSALERLATERADNPDVLRLTLEKQVRRRQVESAAMTAEKLLTLQPDDPAWATACADLQLRTGRADQAERTASSALARHPDSDSLLWSQVRAMVALRRSDEAVALVRNGLGEDNAPRWLVLARLLALLNRPDEAHDAVEHAAHARPDDPANLAAVAGFWGACGRRDRQVEFLRQSLEKSGDDPSRSLAIAAILATGASDTDRTEALAIVDRRIAEDPRNLPALLLKAQLLVSAHPPQFDQAEQITRTALSVDPQSVPTHKVLAAIQVRTGRAKLAAETITAAMLLAPDDPDLLLSAGEIYAHLGNHAQAIRPLHRLIDLHPRNPPAQALLVQAYLRSGQHDRGIAELESAVRPQDRTSAEVLLLADLYDAKGDSQTADKLYQQTLHAEDQSSEAFVRYLRFLARRQRLEDLQTLAARRRETNPGDAASILAAAEILAANSPAAEQRKLGFDWADQLLARRPDLAWEINFRMGLCHYAQRNLVDAETMLLKATTLSPNSPQPVNALAWMYSEDHEQPERALKLLDEFIARGGEQSSEMLDTHAAALLRLGRLQPAREKLTQCLASAGQTSTLAGATFRMGLLDLRANNTADGRTYLRQALELSDRLGGLNDKEIAEAKRLLSGS